MEKSNTSLVLTYTPYSTSIRTAEGVGIKHYIQTFVWGGGGEGVHNENNIALVPFSNTMQLQTACDPCRFPSSAEDMNQKTRKSHKMAQT